MSPGKKRIIQKIGKAVQEGSFNALFEIPSGNPADIRIKGSIAGVRRNVPLKELPLNELTKISETLLSPNFHR